MKLRRLVLFVLAILVYPILSTISQESSILYSNHSNMYSEVFRNPYEVILFFFRDGDVWGFTTKMEYKVAWPIEGIVDYLEGQGKHIEDAVIVIHNHVTLAVFSYEDRVCYSILKRRGFRGAFLLYHNPTGTVKDLDEVQKGK